MRIVIVGAGPVGALAALYAAQRGHDVDVYELRGDLRHPTTVPLNFTKSINLAISERGINALRESQRTRLWPDFTPRTLLMTGRMIHGRRRNGELYQEAQAYDVHGRGNYAADRGELNSALLNDLESLPNVKLHFNHKLSGADFKRRKALFTTTDKDKKTESEIEVDFDFVIGADGAHSAVRHQLMKVQRVDYMQTYIDTLWCEFHIAAGKPTPASTPKWKISSHHLHIWPGQEFMFIAIPNADGSFTCTLFMPSTYFETLAKEPAKIPDFFDEHFPGVTDLIEPEQLIDSFQTNPHLPLISIKCSPYHFSDSVVILGDAAHAMVPFYGQGMNAGLEDVRVLFSFLDKHQALSDTDAKDTSPQPPTQQHPRRTVAFAAYSAHRAPDAHAINDLALANYTEMRAGVTSPLYRARKWLEETLAARVPALGWRTRYARVSFTNERYSEVVRRSERQGRMLIFGFGIGLVGAVGMGPVVLAAVGRAWRGWYGGR